MGYLQGIFQMYLYNTHLAYQTVAIICNYMQIGVKSAGFAHNRICPRMIAFVRILACVISGRYSTGHVYNYRHLPILHSLHQGGVLFSGQLTKLLVASTL